MLKDNEKKGKDTYLYDFVWDLTGSTKLLVFCSSFVAPFFSHVFLHAGDYFGENALLRDEPRSATILAKSELFTFRPMG